MSVATIGSLIVHGVCRTTEGTKGGTKPEARKQKGFLCGEPGGEEGKCFKKRVD